MHSRRIGVRGIINKNGQLLAQRLKDKHGAAQNYWCTPGGGIDPLESLHDALHREMIEETGIAPQIGRLLLVQQFASQGKTSHGESEQLEFFFEISNPDDYLEIDLASTSHGDAEVAECKFIDPAAETLLPNILQTAEFLDKLNDPQSQPMFYAEL